MNRAFQTLKRNIVINDEDASGALGHVCHLHVYDNGQSLNYELHFILRN